MPNNNKIPSTIFTGIAVRIYVGCGLVLAKAFELRAEQKASGYLTFYSKLISIEAASYLLLQHLFWLPF